MRKLFGTDGIRAVAGEAPLDAKTIHAVGVALARKLAENGNPVRVVLGMDTRESGPWIASTLIDGLREGGAEAEFAGVITTPAIAFSNLLRSPSGSPSFSRSPSVRSASTSTSIALLRKAASYWPRPRPRSHSPTSIAAPHMA